MTPALTLLLFVLLGCIFIAMMILSLLSKINQAIRKPTQKFPPIAQTPSSANTAQKQAAITKQAAIAELTVDAALRTLEENRYFVFKDLIIPAVSKSIGLTQIDHVLVSRMGIFCIETKSTHGNIYGFSRAEKWKQYLGNSGKPFEMNSPFRQNHHHVKSLELFLSEYLKAKVHSYIALPNANKVVVDSKIEDMSPRGVISKIANHTHIIYEPSEVERIAKTLAHAGTFREQLRGQHISDVKAYLSAKVDKTMISTTVSHHQQ